MRRTLWTVMADQRPVAVVAADRADDAWRIVQALEGHDTLPKGRSPADLVPCPRDMAGKTLTLARSLGCAATFLACLNGGMFMTHIGGLSPEPIMSIHQERAA